MFIPQEGKPRRTSYSIASAPQDAQTFELCVTHVDGGASSTCLHSLKVGDPIQAMGPLGTFAMKDETADTVFIATGSGIAPFRSMINDRLGKNTSQKLYLLFGNRYESDIIYRQEWEALARVHPQFQVLFTLSRATWDGPRGYVQDKILELVKEVSGKDYYICGLVNMINAVQEKLLSLGVPKERIHFERYD
jgi:ferredoxin-NADP reductase